MRMERLVYENIVTQYAEEHGIDIKTATNSELSCLRFKYEDVVFQGPSGQDFYEYMKPPSYHQIQSLSQQDIKDANTSLLLSILDIIKTENDVLPVLFRILNRPHTKCTNFRYASGFGGVSWTCNKKRIRIWKLALTFDGFRKIKRGFNITLSHDGYGSNEYITDPNTLFKRVTEVARELNFR